MHRAMSITLLALVGLMVAAPAALPFGRALFEHTERRLTEPGLTPGPVHDRPEAKDAAK